LKRELDALGLSLSAINAGYAGTEGLLFACTLVVIDRVTETEKDEWLAIFSHYKLMTRAARQWLEKHAMKSQETRIEELEDYRELRRKWLEATPIEERLAGLPPEQVLSAVPPEPRMAGLPPEPSVLALPIEALRVLACDEAFMATLSDEVRQEVVERVHNG